MKQTHGVLKHHHGWGITLLSSGGDCRKNPFRKFPLKCEEWYKLHVLCQTLGYIIGAVEWSFGMWLGNSSKPIQLESTSGLLWHRYFSHFGKLLHGEPRLAGPLLVLSNLALIDLRDVAIVYCDADACSLLATEERRKMDAGGGGRI
ncbi:hypothetical protein NC653_010172 [Populus alba x Populus x berolinensis]|uniref:Uncharacterized protein n=1 Tax=Populus alba x Populus x berolinensis TaxID=444605 RepID=A0AAD6R070_9ROSI|nr:hypothetical protein NC653_010172 [Populus alba x Populus x berolinensis]